MDHKPVVFLTALCLTGACGSEPGVLCGPGPSCSPHGILQVSPSVLTDSASAAAGAQRVAVPVLNLGGGAVTWVAHVLHASPWITLPVDSGQTGTGDSLVVQLNPAGLSVGTYRDTVLVADQLGGALRLPVEFHVIP